MQNKIFFSIVIPTLNEEKYLPKLLSDLEKQSFFKDNLEVIVVDGNSEDKTIKKAKTFTKLDLKTFVVKKRNVAYQRNFGAKKARGEWIIFMDADNRLPNSFLDGIKYQISKHTDIDVFTTWIEVSQASSVDKAVTSIVNLGLESYQFIDKPSAMGSLIGCKKTVFNNTPFDEKQSFLEDGYFTLNAYKKGYKYYIFKYPKYSYSLRRLKKEGTLKVAGSMSLLTLQYLRGKNFHKSNKLYPMLGGDYYDKENKTQLIQIMKSFQIFLKTASKKQIQHMKKILSHITEV